MLFKIDKKILILKNETENLYKFIKDYHRVKSEPYEYDNFQFLSLDIQEWLEETLTKYGVNIKNFIFEYLNKFSDDTTKWPLKHKKKSDIKYMDYEYDYKQKRNLFNIDYIYPKICKKPFIRGNKQDIEIMMMHYWLYHIDGDEKYFDEYLEKLLKTNDKIS